MNSIQPDREKFQSFLSQITPLVKESGLPLKLLTDAVELAFIKSGNEDWDKVDEYTGQWQQYSTEQLILVALATTISTKSPTGLALAIAMYERVQSAPKNPS